MIVFINISIWHAHPSERARCALMDIVFYLRVNRWQHHTSSDHWMIWCEIWLNFGFLPLFLVVQFPCCRTFRNEKGLGGLFYKMIRIRLLPVQKMWLRVKEWVRSKFLKTPERSSDTSRKYYKHCKKLIYCFIKKNYIF